MAAKLERIDPQPPPDERPGAAAGHVAAIAALRRELAAHPCHGCPDREAHAVPAAKALRLEREIERSQQLTTAAKNSLAASFDKVVAVLTDLGYLADEELTEAGRMLTRVYNELDLVACECVRRGVFDGLDAPALAAVISSLVYESRIGRPMRPARMPERSSEQAQSALRTVWRDVRALERAHRIDNDREPDIGFAEAIWRWASGQELAKVLSVSGLPAGDFVRWTRQVIELAGQLSQAVGPGDLRRTCRAAVDSLRRGVIEYDALED